VKALGRTKVVRVSQNSALAAVDMLRITQHPRQRVFNFASNFLFSTASMSTYGALSSVGVLDAGASTKTGPLIAAGLFVAVEALDVVEFLRTCAGAVPL
jgi:hypothetical protein